MGEWTQTRYLQGWSAAPGRHVRLHTNSNQSSFIIPVSSTQQLTAASCCCRHAGLTTKDEWSTSLTPQDWVRFRKAHMTLQDQVNTFKMLIYVGEDLKQALLHVHNSSADSHCNSTGQQLR